MLVPGHLATAALASAAGARLSGLTPALGRVVLPAMLGGLTPDLLDKSRMALGGSIYGRTVGHSLLFLGAIVLLWAVLRRVRPGAAVPVGFWVLGVASHLAADLADDALRGWMRGGMAASSWFAWPWATPYTEAIYVDGPHWAGWSWPVTPLELAVLAAVALWIAVRRTPAAP